MRGVDTHDAHPVATRLYAWTATAAGAGAAEVGAVGHTGQMEPASEEPLILTVREAAARLRVHESTLRRIIADGEIDHVRLRGRVMIAPDQIVAYINRNRRSATRLDPADELRLEAEANRARAEAIARAQAERAENIANPWGRRTRRRININGL